MATIYRQNGRRIWQVRVWVAAKGRTMSVSTGTDDRKKALAIAAQYQIAQAGDTSYQRIARTLGELMGASAASETLLSQVWELYAKTPQVNVAAKTLAARRREVERFVAWVASHRPGVSRAAQVTRQVAQGYVEALVSAGGRGKTVNNSKGDLSTVWRTLVDRGDAAENPWAGLRNVSDDDSEAGRAFSDDEVARLLAASQACPGGYFGPILVGLYTGLRYGDVAHLAWEEIHGDCIRMAPSKTARHGTVVTIPLHPALAQYLAGLPRDSQYVFPSHAARYNSGHRRREFAAILAAAGIVAKPGEKISFHSLRHTFRTRLAAAGVPQEVAKKLGGWTTDAMAAHYDHDQSQLRAAIARLR